MDIFTRITFLSWGLLAIVVGIFVFQLGLRKISFLWEYKKQSLVNITPIPKAAISGYIDQSEDLIRSPITQKRCSVWEVYVYTSRNNSTAGSNNNIRLYLSSDKPFKISDGVSEIIIQFDTKSLLNKILGQSGKSVLNLVKKPHFMDHQDLISKFRDPRTLDFLTAHNFHQYNLLGLRSDLTVMEKVLVPGDKIFAWGEVTYQYQKTLKAQLVSDTLIWQITIISTPLIVGSLFVLFGLEMCKQAFISS